MRYRHLAMIMATAGLTIGAVVPAHADVMSPSAHAPSAARHGARHSEPWEYGNDSSPDDPWNVAPTDNERIDVAGPFHFGYSDSAGADGYVYVQFFDDPPTCEHPLEDGSMFPGLYTTHQLWDGKEDDYFFYFDPMGGYFDTPLEPDTSYCYTVQSVNEFGGSSTISVPHLFTTNGDYSFDDSNQLLNFDDDGYDVDFHGGNDQGEFGNGNDDVTGGTGDDELVSGGGDDDVAGNAGDDTIYGEDGNDTLDGGSGNDLISGGDGRNRIRSGSGNDRILTVNHRRDLINCGAGRDMVKADPHDRVAANCEVVKRQRRA